MRCPYRPAATTVGGTTQTRYHCALEAGHKCAHALDVDGRRVEVERRGPGRVPTGAGIDVRFRSSGVTRAALEGAAKREGVTVDAVARGVVDRWAETTKGPPRR